MNVLVIDVGGSHIKFLATGHDEARKFDSGPEMTPGQMVSEVKELVGAWKYEAVSIGYPAPARRNRDVPEPPNLAPGWAGFDFEAAFGCLVKLINDAAMQALGSYCGGRLLFLGLGTGLGSAMVVDGTVVPMELAHLPCKKGTYEDYVGADAMAKRGKSKWRKHGADVLAQLVDALQPDDVVLGGGNVADLEQLPSGCRAGDNAYAFVGGFRLWTDLAAPQTNGRDDETTARCDPAASKRDTTRHDTTQRKRRSINPQEGNTHANRNDRSWKNGRQHDATAAAGRAPLCGLR